MTKTIAFKVKFVGKGGVNYDSNDQKYTYNRQQDVPYIKHNNVSFHKGRYYSTGKKNQHGSDILMKKLSVSSDCLFRALFADTQTSANANVMHDISTFLKYISSPTAIIRGYLFTDYGVLRKSSLSLTAAEQTNNAVPTLEVFSRTGPKAQKIEVDDKADNTFFYKETFGYVEYESTGFINLDEIRFIAMSDVHGRMAVNPDLAEIYTKYLSTHFGEIAKPGYYHKSTYDEFPEYGILLNDEQVIKLANEIIKRLAFFSIEKRESYLHSESVLVKVINDPFFDTITSDEDWVTIKSKTDRFDLSKLQFTPSTSYKLVDEKEAIEKIKAVDELIKLAKKKKAANADEAKAKRLKAKEEKEAKAKEEKEEKEAQEAQTETSIVETE